MYEHHSHFMRHIQNNAEPILFEGIVFNYNYHRTLNSTQRKTNVKCIRLYSYINLGTLKYMSMIIF